MNVDAHARRIDVAVREAIELSSAQMAEGLDPADARARELDRLSNGDVDAAGVGVDVHLVIRSVSSWRAHLTPNSEPSGTSPSQTV